MANPNELMLRQWTMLRCIPRYPRKVTARELMERIQSEGYSITKRTVERDLQAMSAIFPLVADERDKPYGWSWSVDAPSFDLPGLSPSQALTFKLAEQYLVKLMPAGLVRQLKPYFDAADHVLKSTESSSALAHWPEKIAVAFAGQPLLPPEINEGIIALIDEALLQEKQIEVIYASRNENADKAFTLHPLGIILRGAVSYLVATVFKYQDLRLFALHRFKEVRVLEVASIRPKDFNLRCYTESGALGFNDYGVIAFKAKFSYAAGQHLYETPLSKDQEISVDEHGNLIVSATINDNSQLRWWLRGFGDDVEVILPITLGKLIDSH